MLANQNNVIDRLFSSPINPSTVKILLLGSGELGKELTIELLRFGVEVVACDTYDYAPAMQVAQRRYVFDMKNAEELRKVILQEKPTLIVPEIEAIATTELLALEKEGYKIAPNARAANHTMNREHIRRLAAEELQIPTAPYLFADSFEEFVQAARELGFPSVVKPIMSSSGKGQSVLHEPSQLAAAYDKSQCAGRTGKGRVIIEKFVPFESEITLLTVRATNGTFFCAPIGHQQEDGDYVFSWQPHKVTEKQLELAQKIAKQITEALGGYGVFGVELFLLPKENGVLFSEVSPRPHDTGMVTMVTQKQSQFALHARAILGLPVSGFSLVEPGASAAFRSPIESKDPKYSGVQNALLYPNVQVRIFGKPTTYPKRRMGVVLANGPSPEEALNQAQTALKNLEIVP